MTPLEFLQAVDDGDTGAGHILNNLSANIDWSSSEISSLPGKDKDDLAVNSNIWCC